MAEPIEALKERIRDANDIVDVIGGYVKIIRAGGSYKALCPFHQEKTPSFHINPQRQSYHCFGCGAGGDVFSFIMQRESLDFMAAMELLADRAGIAFEIGRGAQSDRSDRDLLYRIHDELSDFYQRVLNDPAHGAAAREYLESRAFSPATVAEFRIGFAPEANSLAAWAGKRGFERADLLRAGVLVESEGQVYDRFRGRVMFPIDDALGRTVGFSGRILDESRSPAKYLNSPETELFKKSRILYGFSRARKRMTETGQAIVCEGQLDCIRCQISGFDNTVAPQGTALTEQHARMIKRQADSVVLLFDADEAGFKAALKSAELMLAESLSVGIASLPPGSDPDTLIREQGGAALQAIIDAAQSPVGFLLERLAQSDDLGGEPGRLRAARRVLGMIARSGSAVQRDRFIAEAAEKLGISGGALLADLEQLEQSAASAPAPRRPSAPPGAVGKGGRPPNDQLMILRYLASQPELQKPAAEFLVPELFSDPACRTIFERLMAAPAECARGLAAALSTQDERVVRLAAMIDSRPPPAVDPDYPVADVFFELILRLSGNYMKLQRDRIRRKSGKSPDEQALQASLTNWMAQIKKFSDARANDSARRFLKTVLPKCLTNI